MNLICLILRHFRTLEIMPLTTVSALVLFQYKVVDVTVMELVFLSSIFAAFLVGGESIQCFRCFLGDNKSDLHSIFSVSPCRMYNNSIFDVKTCDACMTLTLEDNSESAIYDCHDRFIDTKLNNTVAIKNILACFSDFCNGDHSLENMISKGIYEKSYLFQPYIFWMILGLSFVIIFAIQFVRSTYGFDEESSSINIPLANRNTYLSNVCSER